MINLENHLSHYRISKNCYVLGTFEKRITIHSQQIRALNLIYSLYKTNRIKPNTKIGIVGAGIGGLMLAFASATFRCSNIKVFEKGSDILSMWRSCTSRWIHPNLYNWPFENWQEGVTKFPFLNWEAGVAANVAKGVTKKFNFLEKYFEEQIEFKFNTSVIIEDNLFEIKCGEESSLERFDILIIAVGFGYDGKKRNESSYYWANDNLEVLPDEKNVFFLSGNGDGGLADLFRIRIKDFSFELLIEWLNLPEILNQIEEIKKIEQNALTMYIDKNSEKEIGIYLDSQYKKIKTPILNKKIKERLRQDSEVIFHAISKTPYNIKSFALNRFLLSRLILVDKWKFKSGKIANLSDLQKTGVSREKIIVDIEKYQNFEVNRFISRHGSSKIIDREAFEAIAQLDAVRKLKNLNSLDETGKNLIFNLNEIKNLTDEVKLKLKKLEEIVIPFKEYIGFFSEEHFNRLNMDCGKDIKLAKDELKFPNKIFKSEEDYIKGIMDVLPFLESGSSIKAVCGNKKWTSEWVKKYFKENYDAVKRNVQIQRIFLLQKGDQRKQQRNTIIEQKNSNIITIEVDSEVGAGVMKEFNVPSTFGFAIIEQPGQNKIVIIHDLSDDIESEFTGIKLTSQLIIKFYENVWNSLYRYSDLYKLKYKKIKK